MKESRRIARLPESATLGLAARAAEMRNQGIDVLSMAVGEPDFGAPAAAREAAVSAISGEVKYTHSAGHKGLRSALASHLHDTRGLDVTEEQIVVGHSCKHVLSSAIMTLVEPGDEVLLPTPTWNSYDAMIDLAGGKPVHVAPNADLSPDLEAIAAAIGPKTIGLLFSTPSNPSGYVWTRAELHALMELAEAHDLWVVSDEIYRRLVHEGEPFCSPASLSPEAAARTLIVDGASKSYAMTGYRIGYMVGPQNIAEGISRLQSQTTGCPNAISQAAYQAMLSAEPPEVASMAAEFGARRIRLVEGLERIGVSCPRPRGAFYAFPNVSRYLDERGSAGFCADLLESQGLAIVPGTVFGMEGHVRLSYALKADRIDEAVRRLDAFLKA